MNPEYDYEFMAQDLPTMDENAALDLNGFNFADLVPQSYKQEWKVGTKFKGTITNNKSAQNFNGQDPKYYFRLINSLF